MTMPPLIRILFMRTRTFLFSPPFFFTAKAEIASPCIISPFTHYQARQGKLSPVDVWTRVPSKSMLSPHELTCAESRRIRESGCNSITVLPLIIR